MDRVSGCAPLLTRALPLVAVLLPACLFPWDDYDPALGGAGETGGAGGAMTTSSGGNPLSGGGGSTSDGGMAGTGGVSGDGTCAVPHPLGENATVTGDNTGQPDSVAPACFPGGEDQVYVLTASADEVLVIDLTTQPDLGIVVRTTCDDVATEISCVDVGGAGGTEQARVLLQSGDTVYIVVDAYDGGAIGSYTMTTSTHALSCGDGVVDPTEACDPPDGVTCSPECQGLPESCDDGVDNDLDGYADCEDYADCGSGCPIAAECGAAASLATDNTGDTGSGTNHFAGSCVGSLSPEDIYSYTATATGALLLTLSSAADLGLYARSSCEEPGSQRFCVDSTGGGMNETYAMPVTNGDTWSVFVDGFQGQSSTYDLSTTFVASTEIEDNGAPVLANPYNDPFIANIDPFDDEDWVSIAVPAGDTLEAEVLGLMPSACPEAIDSALEVYDTDGQTMLAYDDDSGTGGCSKITLPGLTGGTYYVRVYNYNGPIAYQLSVNTF